MSGGPCNSTGRIQSQEGCHRHPEIKTNQVLTGGFIIFVCTFY